MELPTNLQPVLAKIRHDNSLGTSTWYEVVYYDNQIKHKWCPYAGSKTFQDGEVVTGWRYASEFLDHNIHLKLAVTHPKQVTFRMAIGAFIAWIAKKNLALVKFGWEFDMMSGWFDWS